MLAAMAPITPDLMRRMAALAGFAWSDDDVQAIAPLLERSLAAVQKLESLPLHDVEPDSGLRPA